MTGKSVTCTAACAKSINHSFGTKQKKDVMWEWYIYISHLTKSSTNILLYICFARNGHLIASHISGCTFDVILLCEIHSRKTNQRVCLQVSGNHFFYPIVMKLHRNDPWDIQMCKKVFIELWISKHWISRWEWETL